MKFAMIYPLYVQKAERKARTKEEVDQIICWLTGYDRASLQQQIEQESDLETFFSQAPAIHPNSSLIRRCSVWCSCGIVRRSTDAKGALFRQAD
jgi:hypothetical protein